MATPLARRYALSRRIFLVAGCYGLVALLPQYFMEGRISRDFPPAITHPEQFYGFIGVAVAWQVAFLVIARDVVRYRLLMIPAMLEKIAFGGATLGLYALGRVPAAVLGMGLVDLALCAGFAWAFWLTRGLERPLPAAP